MTALHIIAIGGTLAFVVAIAGLIYRHRSGQFSEPAEWTVESHTPRNTIITADFITKDDKA